MMMMMKYLFIVGEIADLLQDTLYLQLFGFQ